MAGGITLLLPRSLSRSMALCISSASASPTCVPLGAFASVVTKHAPLEGVLPVYAASPERPCCLAAQTSPQFTHSDCTHVPVGIPALSLSIAKGVRHTNAG
ncbi:transferase, partial [Trypanosoma cruzi]